MTSEVELYKEQIKVFDLQGKLLGMQDKTTFYEEIREEWKEKKSVSRQVHTIRLFLINSKGGLYVTKRSKLKKENSQLYDKTIGAHVRGSESVEYTVLRECAEELGFPAAMLQDEEFVTGISETDLSLMGIFKKIETLNRFSAKYKYKDESNATFPQITTIVIDVYDGAVKFKDGEISGIEILYPEELEEEMKEHPEKFTEELKILFPKYIEHIAEVVSHIKQ